MQVQATELPGVLLFEPRVHSDHRGYFIELWSEARYAAAGLPAKFVQDNMSYSRRGVLRGLHLQYPHAQGKLVSVLRGEIWDVAVDVRRDSERYGDWFGTTLSAENRRQLYIPEGFAHGFVVTGEEALVLYKVTDFHEPAAETTVLWSDPELGIRWPIAEPIVSAKDAAGLPLRAIAPERLP
ncbi:MAG: dTDP-4-dehydrorhamnose 3,5-epimerase [Planctomycetota bacterium]|nr:dTDP-4-dehydrorhamnose 3,5-epimerase [Planctomycetota bacterium]